MIPGAENTLPVRNRQGVLQWCRQYQAGSAGTCQISDAY